MNKGFVVRLYPTDEQAHQIDQTIGNGRFIYNAMLSERNKVYEELKNNKELLKKHKYKTEKEYKEEFSFLKLGSSRALQQSRINLQNAFSKFYKKKSKYPKFKSKHKTKLSYREPNVSNCIELEVNNKEKKILNGKIKLLKLGFIKFRGLPKNTLDNKIKSVTVTHLKDDTFQASILMETAIIPRKSKGNACGIDLGLKEFGVMSNGEFHKGILPELEKIDKRIRRKNKYLSRKKKGSKNWNKARIKLNKLYIYQDRLQKHYFWHLANKLNSENQVIGLETLKVKNMMKNKKLARKVQLVSWSKFIQILKHNAFAYNSSVVHIDTWFPSSKLCSSCQNKKKELKLSERTYECENCGLKIDRDLNASFNILKEALRLLSLEYSDYKRGEDVIPVKVEFLLEGLFSVKH